MSKGTTDLVIHARLKAAICATEEKRSENNNPPKAPGQLQNEKQTLAKDKYSFFASRSARQCSDGYHNPPAEANAR